MKKLLLVISLLLLTFSLHAEDKTADMLEFKAHDYMNIAENNLQLARSYELKSIDNPKDANLLKQAQSYRQKANKYIEKARKNLEKAISLREKHISKIERSLQKNDDAKKDFIKVGTWNIQNFGESKMGKILPYKNKEYTLPEVIADIIFEAGFTVLAIQEVEGDNLEPIEQVIDILNSLVGEEIYRLTYPEKMGTSSSTAEYLPIIYNNKLLKLKTQGNIKDLDMQRPPHYAFFSVREAYFKQPQPGKDFFDFCLVSVHLAPKGSGSKDAPRQKDFKLIPKLFNFLNKKFVTEDIIIAGDFNCDPTNRGIDGKLWKDVIDKGGVVESVMAEENGVSVVATNTMSRGQRVNDNMIWMSDTSEDWRGVKKVYDYTQIHFQSTDGIDLDSARQISDHLPLWCEFYTERDSR